MSVTEYLDACFFKGIYAFKNEHDLTFNKGCRFINVTLSASGIVTKGHLWKLGRIIQTGEFSRRLPWVGGAKRPLGFAATESCYDLLW